MFHDPALNRTTNGTGLIREQAWYGVDGMEQLRTMKEPRQPIPTFAETVALLMQPENRHVKFNVDVKVQNDPARLFKLMHQIISAQPDWETALAPRILVGLWHTAFIEHAKAHLPYCQRSYIGNSIEIARKYFWDSCDVFSMKFAVLTTADGEKFRRECKVAGKKIMVWTVNEPVQMVEAVRWGIDVILTDVTQTWLDLRGALRVDYDKIAGQHGRTFLWTNWEYWPPAQMLDSRAERMYIESFVGPFKEVPESVPAAVVPASA